MGTSEAQVGVIDGPTLQTLSGGHLVYQVSMIGGVIMTNPGMFEIPSPDDQAGVRWNALARAIKRDA